MKRGILFLLLTTFWGVFVEAGNNKEVPVSNLRVPAYPWLPSILTFRRGHIPISCMKMRFGIGQERNIL